MKKTILSILSVLMLCSQGANAQEWMKIHRNYNDVDWIIPLQLDKYKDWDFSSDHKKLNANTVENSDGLSLVVPYTTTGIDSIEFAYDLTDEEKGHNKYRPFTMHITTEDCANIVEREVWLNCHISIDGKGEYSDYSGTGRIRGRGNSSWEWYDKKPYKFKLDEKSKLLGLEKAKNWNLLANYRDVTDMMNVFAFETARYMGMPNTNHTRFVEVFLNDEYIGTYQLTEKIEVGKNRVNIDETDGVILSIDQDDGPGLSPEATDNFSSSIYGLPMCVKHPDEPDEATVQKAKQDFAELETAIKSRDYEKVDSMLDIPSFIGLLQIHEFLYNVEIDAPRSIYLYRDKDGKYVFGPVWDWDAGYDFDWGDMYTGHTFFSNYKELIYGKDPVNGTGASYSINDFWLDMFNNATFVTNYKEKWASISDSVYLAPWAETQKYIDAMTAEGTYDRDIEKWPLKSSSGGWGPWGGGSTTTFTPSEEISKMSTWLQNRKSYLDTIIPNYPAGSDETIDVVDPSDIEVVATIEKTQSCSYSKGYSQSGAIGIDQSEVETALGGAATELVPLNADGSTGTNTAAGTYGAWFDDNGTQSWGGGAHVFIESNEMYSWNYGCHPSNCAKGDTHIVTMQYRRGAKAVNVVVTFNLN